MLFPVFTEHGSRCGTCTPALASTRRRWPSCTRCRRQSRLSRQARFLAGISQMNLGQPQEAFNTFQQLNRRAAGSSAPEQPRRHPAPPASRLAGRTRTVVLRSGHHGRRHRCRPVLQPGVRLLARQGSPGRRLLAARGSSPQSRRRCRALPARRGVAVVRQYRRGGARERARSAAVVHIRGVGGEAARRRTPFRAGSSA